MFLFIWRIFRILKKTVIGHSFNFGNFTLLKLKPSLFVLVGGEGSVTLCLQHHNTCHQLVNAIKRLSELNCRNFPIQHYLQFCPFSSYTWTDTVNPRHTLYILRVANNTRVLFLQYLIFIPQNKSKIDLLEKIL